MAAADLLNKAGYHVTLFEKDPKAGGLLRYGIPDFKLSKTVIDRRLNLMKKEGVEIRTGVAIGKDIKATELMQSFSAICIATGSSVPRDLIIPGRNLDGIHYAMDFLIEQNRINSGQASSRDNSLHAEGKNVVVIGGGDTGSDCVGTSIRQRAASVTQIEIMPKPPAERSENNPWPYYAKVLKTSTSHEEGCERYWNISAVSFSGENGKVTGIEADGVIWKNESGRYNMEIKPGSHTFFKAELILLAMGFIHTAHEGLVAELGLELDARGNIKTFNNRTSSEKIFAAGDAESGASLVVNAIASGRKAAEAIDNYLKDS
jgi:glutamate synthase (NADPH/NADH) small chain